MTLRSCWCVAVWESDLIYFMGPDSTSKKNHKAIPLKLRAGAVAVAVLRMDGGSRLPCSVPCRLHTHTTTARATANLAASTDTTAVTMRDEDHVPEHLLCCGCLEAPTGRVEQCANGHLLCAEYRPRRGRARTGGSCLPKLRAQVRGERHAYDD
jgi:hypothetical protein